MSTGQAAFNNLCMHTVYCKSLTFRLGATEQAASVNQHATQGHLLQLPGSPSTTTHYHPVPTAHTYIHTHTLWVKIKHPCSLFVTTLATLLILSLLDSTMNWERSYYIIRHLTSNLLQHYLAKFECSTLQLNTIVIQFNSVTNHLLM